MSKSTSVGSNYPHFEARSDGGYDAFVTAGRKPKVNAALVREAAQMIQAWGGTVHLTAGLYDINNPISRLPKWITPR